MLAELAAANAAFGIIKQAIANGREIASVGSQITTLVNSEDDLRERGNQKKNSIFNRLLGKEDSNDIEEFMALEQIKEKKEQLREIMQIYGRAGIWNDWVKFQVEARKKRQKDREEREEFISNVVRYVMMAILIAVITGGLALVVYVAFYLKGI